MVRWLRSLVRKTTRDRLPIAVLVARIRDRILLQEVLRVGLVVLRVHADETDALPELNGLRRSEIETLSHGADASRSGAKSAR